MSGLPILRNIINGTPVDAVDVEYNFQTLQAFVSQELINRDGTVAMVNPLSGVAPTAPQHLTTKQYVDNTAIPIGTIWMYAGATIPAGWAKCDGASKSTTDPAYAALFAVIQYTYGGSGANFNLPSLRGRVPVGVGASAPFTVLGATGGSKDAVVVSHDHPIDHNHPASGSHTHDSAVPIDLGTQTVQAGTGASVTRMGIDGGDPTTAATVNLDNLAGVDSGPAAGGVAGTDKNLQPYLIVNFMVRIGV